jgi:hypothetical protein
MAKVEKVVRKKMGRPPKVDAAVNVVSVQLSDSTLKALDLWAEKNNISRSGAGRALIEAGLKTKGK